MTQVLASPLFPQLDEEQVLDCVHCGICLSVCPTFDLLGTEGDSPRGRIYFVRGMMEGRIELNPTVVRHLDTCLGCRACETACPSGVQYGEILAHARDAIEKHYPRDNRERLARQTLLDLLTQPKKLAPLLWGARTAGSFAGGALVRKANQFLFGPKAPDMPLPANATMRVEALPQFTPAETPRRARVVVLAGCVMQVLFQRVNRATIQVLARQGCDVVVPPEAGCCGALHTHNGDLDGARQRARALIEALERERFDAVISNSAGCGASIKEFPALFHGEPRWEARARAIAGRTADASEYLARLGMLPMEIPVRKRATYHDACHLAHGQQVRSQPRSLLQAVPGLELVEFPNSDWCCGSAGIYNFLQPELAEQLQDRKIRNILSVEPEVVVTGNPGCHSWIEAGLRRRGSPVAVLHTLEVLAKANG